MPRKERRKMFWGVIILLFVMNSCNGIRFITPNTPAIMASDTSISSMDLITISPIPTVTQVFIRITPSNLPVEVDIPTKQPGMSYHPTPSPTFTIFSTNTPTQPLFLCQQVPQPDVIRTYAPNSEVYLSGKFTLCSLPSLSTFDLDLGKLNGEDSNKSDIALRLLLYKVDNTIDYIIREINNARIDRPDTNAPSLSDCRNLALENDDFWSFIDGEVGNAGCVITNDGRISFFRVEKLNPHGLESVELSFVTWDQFVNK